jgi:vitamin B12 transporter
MVPAAAVWAEETNADRQAPMMSEVVVTATRTEIKPEQVGGSAVSTITSEEIEARKLRTVEEALKTVPGLEVKTSGGLGSRASVFLRGADSKNTLVLVDGIMFNDPSDPNRGADLANLTMENVERIEIVRGPMSALYGSNASSGVINVITKKGEGKPSFHIGGEGGSYNTWKVFGGTSGALDRFNFALSASRTDTEGFSLANDDNDRIPHAGNTSEKDGWENNSLSGRFGYKFTEDFDVSATIRYLDSEAEIDDFGPGYAGDRFAPPFFVVPEPNATKDARQEANQFFGKGEIHNWLFDRFLESRIYYQQGKQEKDIFDNDGILTNEYDAGSMEAGWQGSFDFAGVDLLTVGYNYFEETFETESSSEKNADINSFWVSNQFFWPEDFVLTAGVRMDDHETFGSETTWRVAPSYHLNSTGTTLKGSYGTGFRAPSLYELFADPVPAFFFNGGNPDLEPETSYGWDLGLDQTAADGAVNFGVTYFELNFDDRIDYDFATATYFNDTGKTRTKGIEAHVGWQPLPELNFSLNYTLTETEDPEGERLVYRPENKVNFNTRYRFMEKATVNLEVFWVDERETGSFDLDENGNPAGDLDAYWLANVSGTYDITEHLQVYARIENLFDEYYEESWSYATPGISGYAGVKFTY